MQEKRAKEQQRLTSMLQANAGRFHLVVPLEKSDRLLKMDFTASNTELTDEVLNNTERFTDYVNAKLRKHDAKYGIGGYGEHRTIYSRSKVFDMAPQIPEEGDASTQPLLRPMWSIATIHPRYGKKATSQDGCISVPISGESLILR
jgi:hypothetical protein